MILDSDYPHVLADMRFDPVLTETLVAHGFYLHDHPADPYTVFSITSSYGDNIATYSIVDNWLQLTNVEVLTSLFPLLSAYIPEYRRMLAPLDTRFLNMFDYMDKVLDDRLPRVPPRLIGPMWGIVIHPANARQARKRAGRAHISPRTCLDLLLTYPQATTHQFTQLMQHDLPPTALPKIMAGLHPALLADITGRSR